MKIAFADLTHTGRYIHAINFSLGVGYVAAHTKSVVDGVDASIFKYPDTLAEHLSQSKPDILAFSNYMWNEQLHLAFAREAKRRYPGLITIFGGPNFPTTSSEQQAYLAARPEIDFYVDGEGEVAFAQFCKVLQDAGFDGDSIKSSRAEHANIKYIYDRSLIGNAMLPRIVDLDDVIPSPFLTGILDKFFDGKLTPMIQTSRGCPYSCTYCHDGVLYMNKTRRFSQKRIEQELDYVLSRKTGPTLTLADLNWGMFPEDLETARWLAESRRTSGWPRSIVSATAKNQKKRMLDMASLLGDSLAVGASVQSTDMDVLTNVKRSNISIDSIVEMATEIRNSGSRTFSEIILCLPGDTKAKHFKSISDMLAAGIQTINTFQFILLPGTDAASESSREKFEYVTRFRVLPGCIGNYDMFGETVPIVETHEVCVANATMSHEDYLECRDYHLTIAIYNNGGLFQELLGFAEILGFPRAQVLRRIHEISMRPASPVGDLYRQFRDDEARNFHPSQNAIDSFVRRDGIIDAYMAGTYGNNQIFWFKTVAMIERFDDIFSVCMEAVRTVIAESRPLDAWIDGYLSQLGHLIVAMKSDIRNLDREFEFDVGFDFQEIARRNYLVDPQTYRLPAPRTCKVGHGAEARSVVSDYFQQYGTELAGLSYFVHRDNMQALYRQIIDIA